MVEPLPLSGPELTRFGLGDVIWSRIYSADRTDRVRFLGEIFIDSNVQLYVTDPP